MRTSIFVGLACGAALETSACFAGDDGRFTLLDRSLRATLVNVTGLAPGAVRVINDQGESSDVPLSNVAALTPEWWRPGTEGSEIAWAGIDRAVKARPNPAAATGMLLLTDGGRLPGSLGPPAGGEEITWEHPRLARSVFRLEDVRSIRLVPNVSGPRGAAPVAAGDRVVTTNGDVITGFVDSIGDSVKIESEGKKIDLALSRVGSIELANPARAPSGLRLWLDDGTVVGAKELAAPPTTPGEFAVRLNTIAGAEPVRPVALTTGDLVAFTPDVASVVPLASLPIESQRGIGERRYVDPAVLRWRGETLGAAWRESSLPGEPGPPLDAPDIELPGPMSVEWTLPPGAARLAGWAEVPSGSRLWAEFTLVIEGVGGLEGASEAKRVPLASESMSGNRPIVEFNVEIPRPAPERVRISVDPGARGPIQDRVVIRRALLLIDTSAR
jgi:hypothetical protein